jgi:DNA-binding NtrC family response regulator
MSQLLIVEDVRALAEQYAYDLARLAGHDTSIVGSVREALATLDREPIDCVLLDLELPGADGFEFLKKVAGARDPIPVIVYTGTGNYERCVRAVKLGAFGFLDKSEPMERVVCEVENAISRSRLERELVDLRSRLEVDSSLLGESRAMVKLRETISRLAGIPSPVLIRGESGTGKELVARDLHHLGPRAKGPYLAVNCAALPESLVESELFGHEKGAFTGADCTRRGAFESTSGGTLLLDEVGEMPMTVQAKLLRVLEDSNVTRVGGSRPVAFDSRVLAATNRDLDAEARAGRFREDLLYRLNVHVIEVPPLRERLTDVPLLVEHFLVTVARRFGRKPLPIRPDALEALETHEWRRNNVRELRNVVERMVIACSEEEIGLDDVPHEFLRGPAPSRDSGTLKELKDRAERDIVLAALERNDWHVTKTAGALGLADHASLSKIMKRHGLRKS